MDRTVLRDLLIAGSVVTVVLSGIYAVYKYKTLKLNIEDDVGHDREERRIQDRRRAVGRQSDALD